MALAVRAAAALAKITGCLAFQAGLRLDRSPLWLVPGMLPLAAFAGLLTLGEMPAAGRADPACGGIYVTASVLWLGLVEGLRPNRWNLDGTAICLFGTGITPLAPDAV